MSNRANGCNERGGGLHSNPRNRSEDLAFSAVLDTLGNVLLSLL